MKISHLSTNNIVNNSFYESVKDLVVCNICHGVLIDPLNCNVCEVAFCSNCLNTWKLTQKSDSLCPMKCNSSKFVQSSRVLRNLIDKLEFKCKYNCSMKSYKYNEIINHLNNDCEKLMVECGLCKNTVKYLDYKNSLFYQEFVKNTEKIKDLKNEVSVILNRNSSLIDENKRLKKEINYLKDSYELIPKYNSNSNSFKHNSISGNNTDLIDNNVISNYNNNSNNNYTHFGQMELIDKCLHFKGNYNPIFTCCDRSFPCYICHQEATNHPMELSNKVICLYCKEIYSGNSCSNCGAFQSFKKKLII